jgi:hypothetical protein
MTNDLRYAIRSFLRNPGFAWAAILSIAIGVGANTSIYSVASALLLRPLPYADADRLAILWNRSPGLGIAEDWFSTAQYFDIKNGHQGFDEVAIAIGGNYNLTGDGEPERIGTVRVSSNLLPMLGVGPVLGRLFTADDDVVGGRGVAVLNHGTWMRRYGGDPRVVGRSITPRSIRCIRCGANKVQVAKLRVRAFTTEDAEDTEAGTSGELDFLPCPLCPLWWRVNSANVL